MHQRTQHQNRIPEETVSLPHRPHFKEKLLLTEILALRHCEYIPTRNQ